MQVGCTVPLAWLPQGWEREAEQVKDAAEGKGRGAFARVPLPARAYLGDYEGDLLSATELLVHQHPPLEVQACWRASPRQSRFRSRSPGDMP